MDYNKEHTEKTAQNVLQNKLATGILTFSNVRISVSALRNILYKAGESKTVVSLHGAGKSNFDKCGILHIYLKNQTKIQWFMTQAFSTQSDSTGF